MKNWFALIGSQLIVQGGIPEHQVSIPVISSIDSSLSTSTGIIVKNTKSQINSTITMEIEVWLPSK